MKFKKGDNVIVISGSWKNKRGVVLQVLPKSKRLVVEGVNIQSKHTKPSQTNEKGGIVKRESPIAACKVMLIDPKTSVPTKIGYRFEGEKKVRYAKKSGTVLDK